MCDNQMSHSKAKLKPTPLSSHCRVISAFYSLTFLFPDKDFPDLPKLGKKFSHLYSPTRSCNTNVFHWLVQCYLYSILRQLRAETVFFFITSCTATTKSCIASSSAFTSSVTYSLKLCQLYVCLLLNFWFYPVRTGVLLDCTPLLPQHSQLHQLHSKSSMNHLNESIMDINILNG